MSEDPRRQGAEGASRQVEDRFSGASEGVGGYAPGTGMDASVQSGGWEITGTRGGEREAARRRVEAHPEVMPPHPMPVDRHEYKRHSPSLVQQLPLVVGMFVLGLILPRLLAGRTSGKHVGAELVLQLRTGRRGRKAAAELADRLRGQLFRGEIHFR